jgi:hypothetical protein
MLRKVCSAVAAGVLFKLLRKRCNTAVVAVQWCCMLCYICHSFGRVGWCVYLRVLVMCISSLGICVCKRVCICSWPDTKPSGLHEAPTASVLQIVSDSTCRSCVVKRLAASVTVVEPVTACCCCSGSNCSGIAHPQCQWLCRCNIWQLCMLSQVSLSSEALRGFEPLSVYSGVWPCLIRSSAALQGQMAFDHYLWLCILFYSAWLCQHAACACMYVCTGVMLATALGHLVGCQVADWQLTVCGMCVRALSIVCA